MKKITLLLLLAAACQEAIAQSYPTVTIQQIQTVPQDSLALCKQESPFLGDTVITYGTIVMDARVTPPGGGAPVNNAQAVMGRNLWLQSGTGPFSGLDLFTTGVPTPVPGTDVLDLVAGDSVKVTGVILNFQGETEIAPLNIELLASGKAVKSTFVNLSDLNDNNRVNKPQTGEQWEGVYVELRDVTVVTVDPFSNGTRVSFNVADAAGNRMNVSDRFLVQRLPNGNPPGAFVAPTIGTVYDTLRGVIAHSANGCVGGNGRGYEMFPFRSDDYVVVAGTSAPLISNITRNPITPSSAQSVNVFATISDVDGTVTSASLYYAVGVSNTNYLQAPMTASGTTYTGVIPNTAFSNGDLVKYYICATDNDNLSACSPTVPGGSANPLFFAVRDNGTTIYDVQFTPFSDGNSGYRGLAVSVSGIVTASAQSNDLGYVYIQQEGQSSWSGLALVQSPELANLKRGDRVVATGTIQENFGFTWMVVSSVTVSSSNNTLPAALEADPSLFSTYDFATNESFESVLVKLKNPNGKGIAVVDPNADAIAPATTPNFAEYRVGNSVFDPNSGCRVMAGRQTNSAFSSLYVSYINDSTWVFDAGQLLVPACIIEEGDTAASITGVMHYSFSNMKLLPRNNADFENFNGKNCPGGILNIADELAGTEFSAYPNPVHGTLTLRYHFPKAVAAEAVLSDMMGRSLLREPLRGIEGEARLDLSSLPAGLYLVALRAENEVITYRKIRVN